MLMILQVYAFSMSQKHVAIYAVEDMQLLDPTSLSSRLI
jgi:hypothetical protein